MEHGELRYLDYLDDSLLLHQPYLVNVNLMLDLLYLISV